VKIKTVTLILFSQIVFNYTYSQVSGFCGKQNIIRYDNISRPAYPGVFNDKDPNSGFFLRARHGITFEKVISRNSLIGVTLQAYQFIPGINYSIGHGGSNVDIGGYYPIRGYNLGFYKKKFGDNWISPLGGYAKYGFLINYYSIPDLGYISYKDGANNQLSNSFQEYLSANNMTYSTNTITQQKTSFITVTPIIGFGSQRVYFGKIIVDLSIDFGFTLNEFNALTPVSVSDFLEKSAKRRVFRSNVANFGFGIGYLF
jgi:hypothetical protein